MADEKTIVKSAEKLEILKRIDEYERNQWWTKDVADDPETIPLQPDMIDYLNKTLKKKLLTGYYNFLAKKFIKMLVKSKQMVIKEVIGMENFTALENKGAIITCNHFNAFDNLALHHIFLPQLSKEHRDLWKVIREGNYTNFPGLFGKFFHYCNTLPLSSVFSTMKIFHEAVETLLSRGDKILVYAEQGMWWNYRKPRPLTNGGFSFAVKNKVPVLPVFITMSDSDRIDNDGFPIQEYTIHILKPLYADPQLSDKDNIKTMRDKNYNLWKEVYENFYQIPLEYLTK